MAFFGFTPSQELLNAIELSHQKKNATEPLYPLRNQIALLINDEVIDAIITNLLHRFPKGEKRDIAEKLAGYVKASVSTLLKQFLGKASNTQVKKSIEFSEKSLFKDAANNQLLGAALDPRLVSSLKLTYAEILLGNEINKQALAELYKQFAESTVRHFITDFNKTLELGMIKQKVADIGAAGVIKAIHIAIDKIIPHLSKSELKILAEYHDTLFHY